jgi:uncharacterized membrane protein YsdA (DUF1294 family)/cold shock CspA family protein
MRYLGRIIEWNDDRGFGFVTPNGGGDRAFVHIKAFERASNRPAVGVLISYELVKDERGRFNATTVRFADQKPKSKTSTGKAWIRKTIATSFFVMLLLGWLFAKIPAIIVLVYGVMSAFAFLLYGIDKSAAKSNRWRTQESTLHFVELAGGWPGAVFAQDVFQHKSKKAEFQLAFWVMVVLNCAGLAWLLTTGMAVAINEIILGLIADGQQFIQADADLRHGLIEALAILVNL